jgi:hypothetical protein
MVIPPAGTQNKQYLVHQFINRFTSDSILVFNIDLGSGFRFTPILQLVISHLVLTVTNLLARVFKGTDDNFIL